MNQATWYETRSELCFELQKSKRELDLLDREYEHHLLLCPHGNHAHPYQGECADCGAKLDLRADVLWAEWLLRWETLTNTFREKATHLEVPFRITEEPWEILVEVNSGKITLTIPSQKNPLILYREENQGELRDIPFPDITDAVNKVTKTYFKWNSEPVTKPNPDILHELFGLTKTKEEKERTELIHDIFGLTETEKEDNLSLNTELMLSTLTKTGTKESGKGE